jgi:hypothetical protein
MSFSFPMAKKLPFPQSQMFMLRKSRRDSPRTQEHSMNDWRRKWP